MALGEEESRPRSKIRPGCARSSLGVSPFSVGWIGQGTSTSTSTPKTSTAVMHIHHISLYEPNHITGK